MESEVLIYIRAAGYGASVVFFVYLALRLFSQVRRLSSQHGRFIYALSAISFALIALLNTFWFYIDLVPYPCHIWQAIYYSYSEEIFLGEIIAALLIFHCLFIISSLQTPRYWPVFATLAPVIFLLVAFLETDNQLWVNIALVYGLLCTIAALALIYINTRRFQTLLENTYTNTLTRGVKWVYSLAITFVLIFAFWIIARLFTTHILVDIIFLYTSMIPWAYYAYRLEHQNFDISIMEDIAQNELDDTQTLYDATPDSDSLKTWQQPDFDKAVRDFCRKQENFTNPDLSIEDVARAIGTNRTYISRWCSAHGTNFASFITDLRINYARQLLVDTDLSVTEVLEQAGFNYPRQFRDTFYAHFGCLPSEYRRDHTPNTTPHTL